MAGSGREVAKPIKAQICHQSYHRHQYKVQVGESVGRGQEEAFEKGWQERALRSEQQQHEGRHGG